MQATLNFGVYTDRNSDPEIFDGTFTSARYGQHCKNFAVSAA